VSFGFEALARAQCLLRSKISLGKMALLSQVIVIQWLFPPLPFKDLYDDFFYHFCLIWYLLLLVPEIVLAIKSI